MSTDRPPHQERGMMGEADELDGVLNQLTSNSDETRVKAKEKIRRFLEKDGKLPQQWIDQLFQNLQIRGNIPSEVVGSVYYVTVFQASSVRPYHFWKIGACFLVLEANRSLGEVSHKAGLLIMAMKEVASERDIRPVEFAMPMLRRYRQCEIDEYRSAAQDLIGERSFSQVSVFGF